MQESGDHQTLTSHLISEELNERLGERLDPFVHDVLAHAGRPLVVQELNGFFLMRADIRQA